MPNKKTKVVTTTTDTAKRKLGSKKLNKSNLAAATKQVKKSLPHDREVMYNYPKTATTPALRKEFRRKARQTKRRYEKTLANLKKSNDKADKKVYAAQEEEFEQFKLGTYTKGN